MKKLYMTLLILLLAVVSAVGVWSLVDVDATESETENRRLAQKPVFTVEGWLDGSYLSQLETYYSDTFPGRELLLQANRKLNAFYSFSGVGDENLLVLEYQGGAEQGGQALEPISEQTVETVEPEENKPLPETETQPEEETQMTPENAPEIEEPPEEKPEALPEEEKTTEVFATSTIIIDGEIAMDIPTGTNAVIEKYAQALNNLNDALGKNRRMISLVTPNSGQFYSREDFHTGVHDQKAMIDLCYGTMDEDILKVDAYRVLEAHQEEYVFFRTDHHWTALGAYYAYTAFCETVGFEAVPLEQFETGVYENFVGSMYTYTSNHPQSQALKDNPDTLTYYLPIVETHAKYYADADLENSVGYPVSVVYQSLKETESNKYMCFLGGDHPAAVVETAAEGGTCLVLKESYGNAFVPFLTSHYSRIVVIDPREFNREGKPDLDLAAFADEQGVDDIIVINYPFMINSSAYTTWLNRLVGIDLEEKVS